jgi:hypothetical protein
MEPVDSLPHHPKSCIWCIKWRGMFLKLWFWHNVGWIYLDWLKSWLGWANKFSTSHTSQTSLLQDMEPVDSLPNHPKSCIGCNKWLGMFLQLCDLGTMLVGYLVLAQKLAWMSQIFEIPHLPNQSAARHGAHGFPSQSSKISLKLWFGHDVFWLQSKEESPKSGNNNFFHLSLCLCRLSDSDSFTI